MEDYRWKEFEMRVEAHRIYLNIALQTNVFFYAIAGVVLGFYLNRTNDEYLVFALLLPILIAAVLGGIFIYAAKLQRNAATIIGDMMDELRNEPSADKRLDIKDIPDLGLLYILLHIFGWIFFLIGVALIVTPFLKAVPFSIYQPPIHLVLFALAGTIVLIVAGRWTYSFACKHDEKIKNQRMQKLGGDVLDKPKHEQEESRKQRVMAESKRIYVFALLCEGIFIASTTFLLGGVSGVFYLTSDPLTLGAVILAVISAIGNITAIIIAWKSERRNAREQKLKIEQLERELEAERGKPPLPTPKQNGK